MLVGLISDTHIPEAAAELWPQAYARLAEVDLILHAGDVHTLDTVDRLGELAPIYVARGNGDDGGAGRPVMPEDDRVREGWALEIEGFRVGLTHDVSLPENPPLRTMQTVMEHYFGGPQQIVVFGHTHVASITTLRGVLLINPGSPTYPRNLNTRLGTLGFMEIADGGVRAWLEQLDEEGSYVVREQPRYL
jgi:putative phosphoesterase